MIETQRKNDKAYKKLEKKAIEEKWEKFSYKVLYYVAKPNKVIKTEVYSRKELEFIADLDYLYYRQVWIWDEELKCHKFFKEWKEGELSDEKSLKDIL